MFDIGTIWLKTNYFFLSRRNELKKWWVILLIAVAVFLFFFSVTNIALYLIGISRYQAMTVEMATNYVDYAAIRTANNPQELILDTPAVLSRGNDRYDLIITVENGNSQWAVKSISYTFSIDDQEVGKGTDFVLPNSRKFFTVYNVPKQSISSLSNISVSFEDIEWKRISAADTLPRIDFAIENVNYTTSTVQSTTVNRVTADLINNSFYSFWKTKFVVLLYNAGSIVGIAEENIEPFRKEEQEKLFAQWDALGSTVTDVSIIPDINLLDDNNIMR